MPWNNQGGGGWQGGGGRGPWGQGPGKPPGKGGGNVPPDLEEIIRKGQERLKSMLAGGGTGGLGGGTTRSTFILVLAALVAFWGWMSFYKVDTEENGVVLRLGKFTRLTPPGLKFAFWPIEKLEKLAVASVNQAEFGGTGRGEGLMLAGDQNIVDIRFTVQWKIGDANDYLFNIRGPDQLVGVVAESAMREIVGRTPAEEVRTRGRLEAQDQVRDLVQTTLDSYTSGIQILGVQLEKADPPPQVIDAFEEVQRAEQNQNKFIRDAEQYRNQKLGQARGDASKITEGAKAYKARVVAEAQGEAQRFVNVYNEYAKAPDVTRKRIFLETLEGVLSNSNKIIIEGGEGSQGVVPYLPLPEIQKRVKTGGNQ
jgi:membrane protease subunit HflK